MPKRSVFEAIAYENIQIFADGIYEAANGQLVDIEQDLKFSVAKTEQISRTQIRQRVDNPGNAIVTMSDETTLDYILRIAKNQSSPLVVLNFASGTTPGGGFLRGGNAQEESLCRATTLYPAIAKQASFYQKNSDQKPIYANSLIYTPSVRIMRDKWNRLLDSPLFCDVITCPAPNRTALVSRGASQKQLFLADTAIQERIKLICSTLQEKGHCDVLLGAWGCGVFGNEPIYVAQSFRRELSKMSPKLRAHFAIPGLHDTRLGRAFKETFDQTP